MKGTVMAFAQFLMHEGTTHMCISCGTLGHDTKFHWRKYVRHSQLAMCKMLTLPFFSKPKSKHSKALSAKVLYSLLIDDDRAKLKPGQIITQQPWSWFIISRSDLSICVCSWSLTFSTDALECFKTLMSEPKHENVQIIAHRAGRDWFKSVKAYIYDGGVSLLCFLSQVFKQICSSQNVQIHSYFIQKQHLCRASMSGLASIAQA